MDQREVLVANAELELAHRLDERRRLYVSNCTAKLLIVQMDICPCLPEETHFNNTDVRFLASVVHGDARDSLDPLFDGTRDMRNNLDGFAQIVASTLLFDDFGKDFSEGNVVFPAQGDVEIAFIIAQIQVDFTAIVENKAFAVSGRVSTCCVLTPCPPHTQYCPASDLSCPSNASESNMNPPLSSRPLQTRPGSGVVAVQLPWGPECGRFTVKRAKGVTIRLGVEALTLRLYSLDPR